MLKSPTCFLSQRVAHGPFDGHFRPTSFHGLGGSRHSSRFDKLPCITGIWGPRYGCPADTLNVTKITKIMKEIAFVFGEKF